MSRRDKVLNFAIFLVDAVGFPVGIAFFSTQTIYPALLERLGAGKAAIGALTGLLSFVIFVPGLFVVRALARRRFIRGWLFWVALIERLFLLPLAFLVPLWGRERPGWTIAALFLAVFGHGITMGFNMPAYWLLVGKCIPERWRGRLYGFAGGLAGLATLWTDRVLHTSVLVGPEEGFPDGYGRGFLIGFVLLTVSMIPFWWTREPPGEHAVPTLDRASLMALWRTDTALRRFTLSQVVFATTVMAAPFFALHAQGRFGAAADIARYTTILLFAGSFGSLLLGWLADHFGNLRVVVASTVIALVGFLWALLAPGGGAYGLVFALAGLGGAGVDLAGNNYVMELARSPDRIPLYTSLFNILRAIPRSLAPVAGGLLAQAAGYPAVFWLCLLLSLGSGALLLRAHRPLETKLSPQSSL